jgi:hypothetical protein
MRLRILSSFANALPLRIKRRPGYSPALIHALVDICGELVIVLSIPEKKQNFVLLFQHIQKYLNKCYNSDKIMMLNRKKDYIRIE